MLLGTQFHRALERAVLHRHHQRHLCIHCKFCLGWVVEDGCLNNGLFQMYEGLLMFRSQSNSTCCLVSKVSGFAIFMNPLINFLSYPTSPRKALTCLGVVWWIHVLNCLCFEGNGRMPVALRM